MRRSSGRRARPGDVPRPSPRARAGGPRPDSRPTGNVTMAASPGLLARERNLILALLGALALLGWALVLWQSTAMPGEMASPTMGLDAPLFLATWIAMMVAMMFPTAAPMILTFARVSAGKRERGQAFVPTWVFVAAYLLVWTMFGAAAYGLAVGSQSLAGAAPWLVEHAGRVGGVLLIL